MENKELFSHLVELQKTMFEHSYNLMTTWQNQGEQLVKSSMKYNPWCAGSGESVCTFWAEALRQNSKFTKDFVENNFSALEQYLDTPELPLKPTAQKKESVPTTAKAAAEPPGQAPVKKASPGPASAAQKKPAAAKATVALKATSPAKKQAPAKETTSKKPASAKAKAPNAASPAKTTAAAKKAAPTARKTTPARKASPAKGAATPKATPAPKAAAPKAEPTGPVKS